MQPAETEGPTSARGPALVVDIAFGLVAKTLATTGALGRPLHTVGRPVAMLVLRPPLVPSPLQPATWLARAARRGTAYRAEVLVDLEAVLERVLPELVSEITRRVDMTALVQRSVDLVAIANDVIAEIDLPEIIRDSTGAVASDTLMEVRMQSISGDEAIGRAMDRLRTRLLRRTPVPGST